MKKNLKEYIIVFTIIILVGLLLIIIKNNILSLFNEVIDTEWQTGNYEENESIIDDSKNYSINYQDSGGLYNISMKEDEECIYVKQETMYKCIDTTTECPNIVKNEYEIKFDEDSMKKIKDLIISLNNRYSSNEFYTTDLTREERITIRAITKKDVKYLNTNVNYEIFSNANPTYFEISGYKIKKYYNYSSVEIGAGYKIEGIYKIEINEVKKVNNNIYIIVNEIESKESNITPTTIIEIYDKYDNIIIKNKNDEIYKELKY